jgi:hypothetical protein
MLYIMEYSKTETKKCGCSNEFHQSIILGLCTAAIILAIVALCI